MEKNNVFIDMFSNTNILLLGGTGYIGGLVRNELLNYNVNSICVLSRDEYKQFKIKETIKERNQKKIKFKIGDVRDENSIRDVFKDVDYVFDFAAMKHVLICEENPVQAINTNIWGTYNVVRCAMEMGVKKVIFASSDKAVSPSSAYGATKFLAEKILYQYSALNTNTVFSTARFVNILGSRGSVLDKWNYQILNGMPVTITHPDMIRYFITGQEAVQFLFKICMNSEQGMLYIPCFYKIRIMDLCIAFINYACNFYNLDKNEVKIITTGMCEVEKLEECIFNDCELRKKIDVSREMYSIHLNERNEKEFDIAGVKLLNQSEVYELLQMSKYLQ